MRVGIKKKYVVGVSAFLSISLGILLIQEAYLWVLSLKSIKDFSILIALAIFVISTVYVILYFRELRFREKIVDETAKEVSGDDLRKEAEIREHLFNKIWNESYSFRIKL